MVHSVTGRVHRPSGVCDFASPTRMTANANQKPMRYDNRTLKIAWNALAPSSMRCNALRHQPRAPGVCNFASPTRITTTTNARNVLTSSPIRCDALSPLTCAEGGCNLSDFTVKQMPVRVSMRFDNPVAFSNLLSSAEQHLITSSVQQAVATLHHQHAHKLPQMPGAILHLAPCAVMYAEISQSQRAVAILHHQHA